MNKLTHSLLTASASLILVVVASAASAKSLELPGDSAHLIESPLPGYALAQQNCTRCHSAEYLLYQPPTATRAYWEKMVDRMKNVFKGPIDEADIPLLVEYLSKTYGSAKVN